MKIKRTHFFLMTAFGAMFSAGAAAIEDEVKKAIDYVEGKFHLAHVLTGQVCTFDDQAGAENFLAGVDDAQNWAPVGPAPQAPGADDVARLGETRVEVDLNQLRAAVAADTAADAAAVDAPAEPAPAPAAETPAATEQPAATPAAE
jgi:hypothetical protein